jgi:hypothetical protein
MRNQAVVPANQVQSRQGLSVKRLSQTRMKPSMPFKGLRKPFDG